MYKRNSQGGWKHFDFLLIDIICLHISFVLAYIFRHGDNPYANATYVVIVIVATLIDVILVFLFDSFKNVLKRGYMKELLMTVRHVTLLALVTNFYMFAAKIGQSYSRLLFFLQILLYFSVSLLGRVLWKNFLEKKGEISKVRSLLILTTDDLKDQVLSRVCNSKYENYHVCGAVILDHDRQGEKIGSVPIVASRKNVADYICREWVDEVLVDTSTSVLMQGDLLDQIMEMGVVVHTIVSHNDKWLDRKRSLEKVGGYLVLTTSINQAYPWQLFLKRCIDIVMSLVGCLLTGIAFLFVAPAIYLKSPGPIFFSQIRVGKNGKKFKIYKFRSMYPDAEARKAELMSQNQMQDNRMFKVKYDPRIIGCQILPDGRVKKGIGNFLRDSSLDEFPQFFNVLKGDMSIVGTRPPTVDEWEQYDYRHRARLTIKPGLTGMWQVNGRSEITDFEEVVRLDTQYIAEWSLSLDLKIIFKTIGVVFGKVGSM